MKTLAYPCNSVAEEPVGHYSRLCPGLERDWAEHDETQLKILACYMKDSPQKRALRAKGKRGPTVPSGYVYFGQFIDHDITRDNRSLKDASPDVANTRNYRTARLDLDHLYGKDPGTVPCLYRCDGERLTLGPTLPTQTIGGGPRPCSWNDLPRTADGTAIVVDPRNDENLIIAQMHVLFSKFHNCVLKLLTQQPALSPGLAPGWGSDLFRRARRFVTWHYQWLVLNDFLPRIARLAVLNDIKAGSQPRLFASWYTPKDDPMALPVEFSVAAFRFGHSMVQGRYFLNSYTSVLSREIVRLTKRGGGISTHLPENYRVDWDRFFDRGARAINLNRAQTIDTFITEMLYHVPKQTAEAFRFQSSLRTLDSSVAEEAEMRPPLPELTLRRGSRVRLPCGEEFAATFGYEIIKPEDLFPGQIEFFECGLKGRTPLWYYLLREAAIEKPRSEPGPLPGTLQSQKLGTLGSRIVAETLYQLLKADNESILHAGCGWEPPTVQSAGREWNLRSMRELAHFVRKGI